MRIPEILKAKASDVGPWLRRRLFQPLRDMVQVFHFLPLAAGLCIFLLFATSGQMREIYISNLEALSGFEIDQLDAFVAGSIAMSLLSAVLYLAHQQLSIMRFKVIYSSFSNPELDSRMRTLQRAASFVIALVPWLGLVQGLIGASHYLDERYQVLGNSGDQSLQPPSELQIVVSLALMGLALAFFVEKYLRRRFVMLGIAAPPISAAMLMFFELGSSGDMSFEWWFGTLAGALFAILVGIIFERSLTEIVYSPPKNISTDGARAHSFRLWRAAIYVRRRRRSALFVWSLVPWVALMIALGIGDLPVLRSGEKALSLAIIPFAMGCAMALGLTVAMMLDSFRRRSWLPGAVATIVVLLATAAEVASLGASHYGVEVIVHLYRLVGPLGSIVLQLVFVIATLTLLGGLSQRSGFPALALVILAFLVTVTFPIPPADLVLALGAIFGSLALAAAVSEMWAVALLSAILVVPGALTYVSSQDLTPALASKDDGKSLTDEFVKWVGLPGRFSAAPNSGKACTQDTSRRVFIIAAEGGGIYAASAISLMLAELQDECPNFAKHVFAISGVSGGSIGAAVFQALDRSQVTPSSSDLKESGTGETPTAKDPRESDCWSAPPSNHSVRPQCVLEDEVSSIMQDDHLSPVVASIFPELFGAPTRRAQAQAIDFDQSVRSQNVAAAVELCDPYLDHWSSSDAGPGLVLNTTWVENGLRVAFAPYKLQNIGDDSLYAFSDKGMPSPDQNDSSDGGVCNPSANTSKTRPPVSLVEAALDSARFPGILPPYSVEMSENGEVNRWNFVDGAYSDNSGASTALAMYKALLPVAKSENVKLDMILVESSFSTPDFSQINGTQFQNTLAPINAVLEVRDNVSSEAVANVCNFFQAEVCQRKTALTVVTDKTGKEIPTGCNTVAKNDSQAGALHIIQLDSRTIALPLGWKLSRATFDLVRWMVGRPIDCCTVRSPLVASTNKQNAFPGSNTIKSIIDLFDLSRAPPVETSSLLSLQKSNSCTLQQIISLL